jgi:hypothetical protein
VRSLLGDDRRIGLLVGPAGAGKTRTLRAVVEAWQADGGQVIGLSVSQAAADVLADEAHLPTHNTAKWLYETRRGHWQLPERPLLLVDEASMVATADLAELTAQVRHAGGKVLLVGDPAQLAAIHIGGAFDLLAQRHGAAHLEEIRRFTEPWEAQASLQLRRGDPAAIAAYAMRGRLHGGRLAELEDELFDAWRADALGTDQHGARQRVLMIVTTNEQAAVLGERARHALLATGAVDDGPTVRLADNLASVGDHIVTRRNYRRLATTGAGWVVNGDLWTITGVHPNGDAEVVRHRYQATITLPADYLAAHTHLGYATTAHRAQGMTVDACHAMVAADTSHQQLYVAATRGRHANHLWVALDSERDLVADDTHLPTPEQLLSRCLQRTDPDGLSAHQTHTASGVEMGSLARLGAIFEDAARRATDHWLHQHLARHGLTPTAEDPKWPPCSTAPASSPSPATTSTIFSTTPSPWAHLSMRARPPPCCTGAWANWPATPARPDARGRWAHCHPETTRTSRSHTTSANSSVTAGANSARSSPRPPARCRGHPSSDRSPTTRLPRAPGSPPPPPSPPTASVRPPHPRRHARRTAYRPSPRCAGGLRPRSTAGGPLPRPATAPPRYPGSRGSRGAATGDR